jgi:purine-binding chemotaxis protein CheW
MGELKHLVVFRLDEQRYALPLPVVDRIVRAVELTPLPRGPVIVLGIVDMAGQVLPVIDVRQKFGLPESPLTPAHHLLIAQTDRRSVALVIDEAQGLIEVPEADIVNTVEIVPNVEQIGGAVRLSDGLVLIQDLEKLLSLEEERGLDEALKETSDVV